MPKTRTSAPARSSVPAAKPLRIAPTRKVKALGLGDPADIAAKIGRAADDFAALILSVNRAEKDGAITEKQARVMRFRLNALATGALDARERIAALAD